MTQQAVRDEAPRIPRRTISAAMRQIFHADPQADADAWFKAGQELIPAQDRMQLLHIARQRVECAAFRPVWDQRVIITADCVLQCGRELALLPLALIYRMNLLPEQASCTLQTIVPADSPLADPGPDACGDDLLPHLTAASARRLADRILAEHLPGADRVTDPALLAASLGLRVMYLRLASAVRELGFFCFGSCIVPLQDTDGQPRCCRVPAGTVVVNLCRCPPEEIGATVLHELCHWFLECPSRLLSRLYAPASSIALPLQEMEHSAELLRMCLQGVDIADETCVISPAEARALMERDPAFVAIVRSGRYIYMDDMFCSSSPSLYRKDGRLSAAVRRHPAEYCLRFRRRPGSGERLCPAGHASRLDTMFSGCYELAGQPLREDMTLSEQEAAENANAAAVVERSDSLRDVESLYHAVRECGSFPDAAALLRERLGFTNSALAAELGVTDQRCSTLMRGKNPSGRFITALSVALCLPDMISAVLFDLAGIHLKDHGEDFLMKTFLANPWAFTVEGCNRLLEARGMQKLMKGEK